MKIKNFIFVTFFLAAASLGFALPPKSVKSPVKGLSTNSTQKSPAKDLSNNSDSTQLLDSVPSPVLGGLSAECQSTLLGIATSPEFLKCIPIPSLLPLLPLVTDPSILANFIADPAKNYPPVEQPLLQFATIFCPAPKCSDQGVSDAVKAIQDGCGDDLKNKNLFIQAIFTAAVFYSPIKDITCFKDNDKFCWDETVLTFISLPPAPFKITGNQLLDAIAVADPPVVCSSCNQKIVDDFLNFVEKNQLAQQLLQGVGVTSEKIAVPVAVKCGAKFLEAGGKNDEL